MLQATGQLYTLGYAAPGAMEQLETWMADPMTLLVDVRLVPRSRWYPQWNKRSLVAQWGERYTHEHRLGNVNYKDRSLSVQLRGPAPEQAIERAVELLYGGYSLVLLCVCKDGQACHRTVVADLIHQRQKEVSREFCG